MQSSPQKDEPSDPFGRSGAVVNKGPSGKGSGRIGRGIGPKDAKPGCPLGVLMLVLPLLGLVFALRK